MVHRNESTQLQDALLAPGGRLMEKVIGYVSAIFAAVLCALDLFILTAIVLGAGKLLALWALLAFSTPLTYFLATVGYRLMRARPNSVGSIASPAAWLTCFALFSALTLIFIVGAIAQRDLALAQGAAMSALLALLAFGAASHFHRRK